MASPLEDLAGAGKALRAEPPDDAEISGLIRSGKARLKGRSRTYFDGMNPERVTHPAVAGSITVSGSAT